MIVLDENFGLQRRELLRGWRIRFRHVGSDLLRQGADDTQIIPLLRRLTRRTFFSWDRHFYDRDLRHHNYCVVHLDVARPELARFTRRFLRHPAFRANAQRLSTVVHVGYAGVRAWRPNAQAEAALRWTDEDAGRQVAVPQPGGGPCFAGALVASTNGCSQEWTGRSGTTANCRGRALRQRGLFSSTLRWLAGTRADGRACRMVSTLETALAGLDREQLQRILLALVERTPELAQVIVGQVQSQQRDGAAPAAGAPGPSPPSERRLPVDPKPFGRRMRDALRSASRYADTSGRSILAVLDELLDAVRPFVEADDGRNAIAILEAVTDPYVAGWFDFDDSDNELGSAFQGLGALWVEAILGVDLRSDERHAWAERLAAWQKDVDDYGVDEAFTPAEQAAREGWDDPQLQRILRGEAVAQPPADPRLAAWAARTLTQARLNVLARRGRTDEYLHLAAAEGLVTQRATMLARVGRVEEAAEYGLATLTTASNAHKVAEALHAQGATAAALRVAEHGLHFPPPTHEDLVAEWNRHAAPGADGSVAGNSEAARAALASWLRDAADAAGEPDRALAAATVAIREKPSLADYLAVKRLAGDNWPTTRDALLAHLRQHTRHHEPAQVDILLHEGLTADAMAVVDAIPYLTSYHYSLVERVVEAAIDSDSDWAMATCRGHADRIMDAGKSQSYQHAARWLDLGWQAAAAVGPEQDAAWSAYLDDLIVRHARKRSLVPLLRRVRGQVRT